MNNQNARDWYDKHKSIWLCVECNNKTNWWLRCGKCNKRRWLYSKKYRKEWKEKWLCFNCWKETLTNKNLCLKHYLKQTSSVRLWTNLFDKQLEQLMIKQNFKCALTWDSISWWDDIELDHIISTSKWWSNTLDNVQWTTKEANRLKQDMSIDELKIICTKIIKNFA
jgi:hypothetical protein